MNRMQPDRLTLNAPSQSDARRHLDPLADALSALAWSSALSNLEPSALAPTREQLKKVVIFGAGPLGKLTLEGATGAGLDVLAFADNNQAKWGSRLDGIEIMSPGEAVSRFNEEACFVAAVYNGTAPRKQLAELNCQRIVPYPLFYWLFSQHMPSERSLEQPDRVAADPEAIRAGYAALSDARSRIEFAAQIRWRRSLDYDCLPAHDPQAEMYYPADLVHLSEHEVLVDCGAFDGDSIQLFLKKTGGRFRYIYALEPDAKNRGALHTYLASLAGNIAQNICVLPFGLSDRDEIVSFDSSGTVGSRVVAGGGSESIECRRLDNILDGPAPTFIKMDIEGAEPKAILGASATIRAARPVLAACAYHKCEHLWTLPALLKAALPDYQIFLRRYAEECWETVYYAIPPERLLR
jgi:FkbM family methyltransferase